MIENYKGWDIELLWSNKTSHISRKETFDDSIKENIKWLGVNLIGQKIYGRSLKEIRHMIDYPEIH